MNGLIFLIIYLTGYMCAYYTMRYYARKEGNYWDWADIGVTAVLALGSWFSIIATVTLLIPFLFKGKKPPKWL